MKITMVVCSIFSLVLMVACSSQLTETAIEERLDEFVDVIDDKDLDDARDFLIKDKIDDDEEDGYQYVLDSIEDFSLDADEIEFDKSSADVKITFEYNKHGIDYSSTDTYELELEDGEWFVPEELLLDILSGVQKIDEDESSSKKRKRQATTLKNMQTLAQSVEAYEMDNNNVGSPKCGSIYDLMTLLINEEYETNTAVIKDGWGNDLIWSVDYTAGVKNYTITSYGSDGMPGPMPAIAGIVKKYQEDIIWSDGAWVQKPEGRQTSR